LVGLLVFGGEVFLCWNGQPHPITSWNSDWKNEAGSRSLKAIIGDQEFFTEYQSKEPVATQYYSEDEEDADFGLWLHNVLSSEVRRKGILEGWEDVGGWHSTPINFSAAQEDVTNELPGCNYGHRFDFRSHHLFV